MTRVEPPTLQLPAHRHPVPTRTRIGTRRLPVAVYLGVLVLIPVIAVSVALAAGWWRTTGPGLASMSSQGAPTGISGPAAAPAVAAEVRGSMTVRQVVDAFPAVTVPEVLAAFGAPADTSDSVQLKTLVEAGDLDVPAFRTWLEARTTR